MSGVTPIETKRNTAWRTGLILTKKDRTPKKCLANVLHVLSKHQEWSGVIAFDAFAETVVCLKEPPTREQDRPQGSLIGDWTDEDSARTVAWISSNCEFEPSVEMVEQAILSVGRKREVHPVRDYLEALIWDGVVRLPALLVRYFGAIDTAYVRAVGTKWMISAVARAFRPGCQADYMLVLEGEQGTGKSTGIRTLGGNFCADTGIVVGDKDSYQALRRIWIYEFAELAAIKGRESERVKNFISSRQDHYRPSYGRRTRDFPRQCVFCGSTNERQYLPDRTGNRRFWPVCCGRVDVAALAADRDQLWSEAVVRFSSGETWHTDSAELVKLCQDEQADRQAPDDWIPIVAEWLKAPTLPNGQHERKILDASDGVTTADVLLGAIGMRAADINNGSSTRAGHVLRDLGYSPSPNPLTREGGKRVRVYRCTANTPESAGCAGEGVQPAQQQLGLK